MVMRVLSGSPSCPVCICKIVQSTSQQRVCYYPFWSNNHFYAHFCVVSKAIKLQLSISFCSYCVFSNFPSGLGPPLICMRATSSLTLESWHYNSTSEVQKRRWRDYQLLASSHDCLVMRLKEDFENFNEPFATWLCLRQAAGSWWWCGRGYEYTAARHWRWC